MSDQTANHQKTEPVGNSKTVWDLPVRVFHWSLVLLFLVAWISSDGDRWLDIHIFAGYAIAGLILFRVIWGFTGTYYAQFKHFRYSFKQAKDYALNVFTGSPPRHVGHNPAGSWAIYLLLSGLFLVVLSGFFVFGGEEGHGLASSLYSEIIGWLARNAHNALATLMLVVIIVHIAGVLIESHKHREKLILSMLTGRKNVPEGMPAVSAKPLVAVILVLALLAYFFSAGIGWIPGKEAFEAQFTGKSLATSATWQEECGACHLAYHPSLLPSRSWQKLLQQQHQHFAEDLYLEPETIQQLTDFAVANSAEKRITEFSRKIMDRMKPSETPLRITETRYWKHKHDEVSSQVWQQTNINGKGQCDSCHSDARQGWFEDSRMSIPDAPADS